MAHTECVLPVPGLRQPCLMEPDGGASPQDMHATRSLVPSGGHSRVTGLHRPNHLVADWLWSLLQEGLPPGGPRT